MLSLSLSLNPPWCASPYLVWQPHPPPRTGIEDVMNWCKGGMRTVRGQCSGTQLAGNGYHPSPLLMPVAVAVGRCASLTHARPTTPPAVYLLLCMYVDVQFAEVDCNHHHC